jgi:hypothetical protein
MKSRLSIIPAIALFFFSSCGALAQTTTATVGVTSSPNPSVIGQQVSFFVQVFGTTPTGTVQLMDGAVNLGAPVTLRCITGPCIISGATLQTSALTIGPHVITAAYSGDNTNTAASGTMTQVVLGAATSGVPGLSTWIASLLVVLIGTVGLKASARLTPRRR